MSLGKARDALGVSVALSRHGTGGSKHGFFADLLANVGEESGNHQGKADQENRGDAGARVLGQFTLTRNPVVDPLRRFDPVGVDPVCQ